MAWKPRIEDTSKPKFLALVDALEADIVAGRLNEGERLPPQRDVASKLGVTIATVTRAFGEATRRGLVSAKTGSGTYVRREANVPPANASATDLSLNTVPSSPTKPYLDDALAQLGHDRRSELLLAYQPAIGSDRHRRVIATWFGRRLPPVDKTELALTHGALHALSACFAAFVEPGDTVLSEAWTYTGIRRLAGAARAELIGVAMDDEGMCPDALAHAFEQTGSKLLICSAAVQNPTTATMSRDRRGAIVDVARRFDAILIEDDIYGLLSGDPETTLAALAPDLVVYVSSVAKCVAPGIRLGIAAVPKRLSANLRDRLVSLQWTAPSLFAELVTRLIESGDADACVAAHQREIECRLRMVAENWPDCPTPKLPSYHLWVETPQGWRVDDVVADLLVRGIRVSPSTHFRVDDNAQGAEPRIRLCLGSIEDAAVLPNALRTMKGTWDGQPRLATTVV